MLLQTKRVTSDKRKLSDLSTFKLEYNSENHCYCSLREDKYLSAKQAVKKKPNRTVTCELCGKDFDFKSKLNRHLNSVHLNNRPYPCVVCSKKFRTKKDYANYKLYVHDLEGRKLFGCWSCGLSFMTQTQRERHEKCVHLRQNATACESFSSKTYLKYHQKAVHQKLKEFTCAICKVSFKLAFQLMDHANSAHDPCGAKAKFVCESCDKSCPNKGGLVAHMKNAHLKLKPLTCKVCQKSFSYKLDLTGHMTIHTGEKTFTCEFCGKVFAWNLYLSRHIKAVHKQAS